MTESLDSCKAQKSGHPLHTVDRSEYIVDTLAVVRIVFQVEETGLDLGSLRLLALPGISESTICRLELTEPAP